MAIFLMANVAREQLKADIVEFVLAPRSRWKEGAIDVEERLSMLKAYLNDCSMGTYLSLRDQTKR